MTHRKQCPQKAPERMALYGLVYFLDGLLYFLKGFLHCVGCYPAVCDCGSEVAASSSMAWGLR
jgi:hypothetical protein